ncbi:GRIP and coiled-coil domain-containing protein 2-like [Diabrotica virgifera virgifera]|uniref:GRIP and coiled-coil domain-containing protein 2-like n=1 Tax=Diabrotica virgifera virgifera TaxID=50390 RepID=A0A6P7GTH3_DIAVI|nr:GRIP and coiled-coil domain-containing protein 2-like [Diabrotica virgifera virgifera]
MKILLVLLLFTCNLIDISGQRCSRPEVVRRRATIYKAPMVKVEVLRCLFNDTKKAYSDITTNCLTARKKGIFKDKYDDVFNLKSPKTPIVLESYVTDADPLQNKLILRSKTICNYNRGFCFDPKESPTYAAVWNVVPPIKEKCPAKLEPVISAAVDIWKFVPEKLQYLFYYSPKLDEAFSLRLTTTSKCNNKPIWFTEEVRYIVQVENININPAMRDILSKMTLPSKSVVSEKILKDCDLKSLTLDFDAQFLSNYFADSENVKTVFSVYRNYINKNKLAIDDVKIKVLNNDAYLKRQASVFGAEFRKNNVTINSLIANVETLKNSNKNFEKLSQRINSEMIFVKVGGVEKNFKDLENTIKSIENNVDKLNKISFYSRNDVDQKFLNFYKNVSSNIKTQVINVGTANVALEKSILNKLKPVIESAKKNYDTYANKVEAQFNKFKNEFDANNIAYDTRIKKSMLESSAACLLNISIVDTKVKKIENDLQSYKSSSHIKHENLYNALNKLRQDLKTEINKAEHISNITFNPLINDLKSKTEACFTNINTLKSSSTALLGSLQREIKSNLLLRDDHIKASGKDHDNFNKRLGSLEENIKQLQENHNVRKNIHDKFFISTNNTFKELTLKLTNVSKIIKDSQLQSDANIFKRLDGLFVPVNSKIKTCLDEIQTVKKNGENSYNDLKKTINQELEKNSVVHKADIKDLDTKLKQYKNNSDNSNKRVKDDINNLEKTLKSMDKSLDNRLLSLETEISVKINPDLKLAVNKIDNCQNDVDEFKQDYSKLLDDVKKTTLKNITITSERLEKNMKSFENSWVNQLKISENKMKDIQTNLGLFNTVFEKATHTNSEEIVKLKNNLISVDNMWQDFSQNFKKNVLNVTNKTVEKLYAKNAECEKDINDAVQSLGHLKKTVDEYLREHKLLEHNILRINTTLLTSSDNLNKRFEFLNQSKQTSEEAKNLSENLNRYKKESEQFYSKTGSQLTELFKNITNLDQVTKDITKNLEKDFNPELKLLKNENKNYLKRFTNLEKYINNSVDYLRDLISNEINSSNNAFAEIEKFKKNFGEQVNNVITENKRFERELNSSHLLFTDTTNQVKNIKDTIKILSQNIYNNMNASTISINKQLSILNESVSLGANSSKKILFLENTLQDIQKLTLDNITTVQNELKLFKNNFINSKEVINKIQKIFKNEMNVALVPYLKDINNSISDSNKDIQKIILNLKTNYSLSNQNILEKFNSLNETCTTDIAIILSKANDLNKRIDKIKQNLSVKLESYVQIINNNTDDILKLKKSLKDVSSKCRQSLEDLRTHIKDANIKIELNRNQTEIIKKDLHELTETANNTTKDVNNLRTEIVALKHNYNATQSRLDKCEATIKDLIANFTACNCNSQNKSDSELEKLLDNRDRQITKKFEDLLKQKDDEIAKLKEEFNNTISEFAGGQRKLQKQYDSCCNAIPDGLVV